MSGKLRGAALALLVLLVAAVGLVLTSRGGDGDRTLAADACGPGYQALSPEYLRELRGAEPEGEAEDAAAAAREAKGQKTVCLREDVRLPEPYADLQKVSATQDTRFGRGAGLPAALRAKQRATRTDIKGTAGSWTPVGKGPLLFDKPGFVDANGLGDVQGRVADYAYDPEAKRVFAAVGHGGVWASDDAGDSWRSIGDGLPTQIVGAVGWSKAGGGTLLALTGDNSFGGSAGYGGVGLFWSTDLGRTWNKAKGAPDGATGFRIAVRQDKPEEVYLATGFGLFRSTDAGRTFTDVQLPVGDCAGQVTTKRGCFLASVVTDVVVQSKDEFGHEGGAVLAAVGWRAGRRENPDGSVQAPANGLYKSGNGSPGSFTKIPDSAGFLSSERTGRVSLGIASGPDQDHGYVYAMAQDAVLFNTGKVGGLDVPDVDLILTDPTATPTYLGGVYVSPDFGESFTTMATGTQFLSPTSGSTLAQLSPLGFGPGIQSWYNSWIEPSPTGQVGGAPTRLFLGLEEVYQSRTDGTPQAGPTDFQAVGTYAAVGGPCILVVAGQACSQVNDAGDLKTTHPDQHAGSFLPDPAGGERLLAGGDGGNYVAKLPAVGTINPSSFGRGAQRGFNTLLPYSVAVAKDGVVWSGLQDNGHMKIEKDGTQIETYGGDGTYALVDPDDSDIALEATPGGALNATRDGGRTFRATSPLDLEDPPFLTPFVMDPRDKKHLLVAGSNVLESTKGIDGLGDTGATPEGLTGDTTEDWKVVFDLGTQRKPGDKAAVPAEDDPVNVATQIAVDGATQYVTYCGVCDPVRDNKRFKSGLATNVGGTWHIAGAKGLPQRIPNHVAIDPADPKTVYVALGSSTSRPYVPANGLGDDGVDPAGGHVYKSTDGGETFRDVSGDLPKVAATWILVRGEQLLVANTLGVFASRSKDGGEWGLLGTDYPAAPVFSMTMDPADPDRLVIASYGRGIYSYRFADPKPGSGAGGCTDRSRPVSTIRKRSSSLRRSGLRIAGTTSDRGCRAKGKGKVRRVTVSVARKTGKRCQYVSRSGRLGRPASCKAAKYLLAAKAGQGSTVKFGLTLRKRLRPGRYQVLVRAIDTAGNRERKNARRNSLLKTVR